MADSVPKLELMFSPGCGAIQATVAMVYDHWSCAQILLDFHSSVEFLDQSIATMVMC
jgi:hypothetical protein